MLRVTAVSKGDSGTFEQRGNRQEPSRSSRKRNTYSPWKVLKAFRDRKGGVN